MKWNMRWSRRAFLQGIGYSSALGFLDSIVPGSNASLQAQTDATSRTGFAYVGSTEIQVYEVTGDTWKWKQSIPSRSPVSLTLHPNQQFLYAVNEVEEHESLPRGTVEAYKIDANGTLSLLNQQPLSLSGIKPRHAAISPDGKHLVVAIHSGGAYNVLPIYPDGTVGRVTQILKEVGASCHPVYQSSAHPHTAAFDAAGQHLLATDEGCDRISIFTFQNGQMIRTIETPARPASGPGQFVLHPTGNLLYVSNTLDGSIDCYRWHADAKKIEHVQSVVTTGKSPSGGKPTLAISTFGRFLYATSPHEGITVWEIDPKTRMLSFVQQWSLTNCSSSSVIISPDDRRLFVLDSGQNSLLSIPVHYESGKLGTATTVAKTALPRSLIMKYI